MNGGERKEGPDSGGESHTRNTGLTFYFGKSSSTKKKSRLFDMLFGERTHQLPFSGSDVAVCI